MSHRGAHWDALDEDISVEIERCRAKRSDQGSSVGGLRDARSGSGDLVSITAAPRPTNVKMVVQTAKPALAEKQVKGEVSAQDRPQPVKTASK